MVSHSRMPSWRVCLFLAASLSVLFACRPESTNKQPEVSQSSTAIDTDETETPTRARGESPSTSANWSSLFTEPLILEHVYRNGQDRGVRSILESLGGGVGILDFDNDGRSDICLPGGGDFPGAEQIVGRPTALYQNHTISPTEPLNFKDRSQSSRLDIARFYTHGIAIGDYDNDGFSDLLITGYGGVQQWHNQGDGTFVEVSSDQGLASSRWSSSAAWGDFNSDGNLDLFLVHYVDWSFDKHPKCLAASGELDICPPKDFSGLNDLVFMNRGNERFESVGESMGLATGGKGLGVLLADLNADGRLDAYVANDTTENFVYLNTDGKLQEVGGLSGAAVDDRGIPNGSMGLAGLDFNKDGLLDIWVTNYEEESFALYRNDADGFFVHVSRSAGVTSLGQQFVGFGTAALDVDRDGDQDLLVANGHVILHPRRAPRRQIPLVLENQEGRFRGLRFSPSHYFGQPHEGRGLALADFNQDGNLDVAISHLNEPAVLLANQQTEGSWLKVKLVGTDSNRDAVGASVVLVTAQGEQLRQIVGGGSYLSTHDNMLHWGFASDDEPLELRIRWPNGKSQVLKQLLPAQTYVVVE